jgi:hypothetical protein
LKPATLALFLLCLSTGEAQSLIIPQIADGGGWQTTIVLTNSSASATTASLTFFQETGGGSTQNWNLGFLETSTPQSLNLPAAGTLFLHTPGAAGSTTVGWAQLQANSSVNAYAIFTQSVPGRPNQDGTANAASASSRLLIPYDNTNGNVTAIALVNPAGSSQSITAGIQPTSGGSSQPAPIVLPTQGHTSFTMPQQFPSTTGQSGLLELNSTNGSFSGLALRFNPTGGFTTAPVYPESGAPIIGASGSSTSGTLPQYSFITITGTITVNGAPNPAYFVIGLDGTSSGYNLCTFGSTSVSLAIPSLYDFAATFGGVSVSGQTFTMSNLQVGSASTMTTLTGTQAAITAASLTLTFTPNGAPSVGQVTGTYSVTSSLATLTGTISGSYTAN